MTDETLEILISKFLDSEITPGERRLLDAELAQNAESRRLFQAMERIHGQARTAVSLVTSGGRQAAEVFEQACTQSRSRLSRAYPAGWRRFAAGLAAGLIIGAGATVYVLRWIPRMTPDAQPVAVAGNEGEVTISKPPAGWPDINSTAGNAIREVDLYNFTDASGGQWLVEGLREKHIQPAMYYQDL